MLYTPETYYLDEPHPCWRELLASKHRFLHNGITAMARYCQRQAVKYGLNGSRIAALRAALEFLAALPEGACLAECREAVEAFVAKSSPNEGLVRLATIEEPHRATPGLYLEVCDRKVPLEARVKLAIKVYRNALDQYGERALLAEQNKGVDWKALMHAVRVAYQAEELLRTGHITFPRPERALLLQVREGQLPYADVTERIERALEQLSEAQRASALPTAPDPQAADEFVARHYAGVVSGKLLSATYDAMR